jgi:hypothetical protein
VKALRALLRDPLGIQHRKRIRFEKQWSSLRQLLDEPTSSDTQATVTYLENRRAVRGNEWGA